MENEYKGNPVDEIQPMLDPYWEQLNARKEQVIKLLSGLTVAEAKNTLHQVINELDYHGVIK